MSANRRPYQCLRIAQVQTENSRTRSLVFDQAVACAPGQFVMAWLPGVDEKPFSIVQDDPFTLTIVSVGSFSRAVNALEPGDRLWIRGPLGKGFSLAGDRLLLAGGGYGAAPLYFLAKNALSLKKEVVVCLGAKEAGDVLFEARMRGLGCEVWVSTENGSAGHHGLVTDLVRAQLKAWKPDGIYGCGPVKMLETLQEIGEKEQVPCQLSWESLMRCGIGLCGSCEVQRPSRNGSFVSWLTCSEGPVWKNYP